MHSEIHLRVALRSTPDAAGSELYRCNNVDFEVRPGVLSGRLAAKLSGSDSSLESMTIGLPGCPLAWGGFPFCIVGLTNRTSKFMLSGILNHLHDFAENGIDVFMFYGLIIEPGRLLIRSM